MTDSSGRIEDGVHRFPVRIYYEDTDAAGIVYYANYLKFAERARTEWMRLMGAAHGALAEQTGAVWAVRRCVVDYLRPARLDDMVEVRTRLNAVGGASAEIEQAVFRDGEALARLEIRLAFVTLDGRPCRLPAALRARMQSFVQQPSRP